MKNLAQWCDLQCPALLHSGCNAACHCLIQECRLLVDVPVQFMNRVVIASQNQQAYAVTCAVGVNGFRFRDRHGGIINAMHQQRRQLILRMVLHGAMSLKR